MGNIREVVHKKTTLAHSLAFRKQALRQSGHFTPWKWVAASQNVQLFL